MSMKTLAITAATAVALLATGAQASEVKAPEGAQANQIVVQTKKVEKPATKRFFFAPGDTRTNPLLPLGQEYNGPTSAITIGGVL